MPVKISGYTSFDDALKQSGELAFEMTTQLISSLTPIKVLNLLKDKVLAVAKKHDGEKINILLQMIRKQFVAVCIEEEHKCNPTTALPWNWPSATYAPSTPSSSQSAVARSCGAERPGSSFV